MNVVKSSYNLKINVISWHPGFRLRLTETKEQAAVTKVRGGVIMRAVVYH
jgi:hypothetical protein